MTMTEAKQSSTENPIAVGAVSITVEVANRESNDNVLSSRINENCNVLKKDEVYEKRKRYFSSSNSISYENTDPLMIVKGRGSKLIDENDIEYLDTRNNVAHCGHCHPVIVKAVQDQVALVNTNTRYLHPTIVELAEQLLQLVPMPLSKVFFVNSGSEANDLALRLARVYSGGCLNTIVVDHAYHGHTLATLEVSPYKYEHEPIKEYKLYEQKDSKSGSFSSPGKHIWKVPCPDLYRGIHRDQPDIAASLYAAYVEEACEHFANENQNNSSQSSSSSSVRAFILEGGMSVAGVIIPPSNYIRKAVTAVRAAGGLYIADEVQTGFGRFGTSMWAFQHTDNDNDNNCNSIVPDIVTIGKPFGNGIALGAVITTDAVVERFEDCQVEYFNTFGGNPVSAAAGLAMLNVLHTEQLQNNAVLVGTHLREQLLILQKDVENMFVESNVDSTGIDETSLATCYIGDIRGSGLFLGIDFVMDVQTRQAATTETSFVCTLLKSKYRILSSIDGPHNNVLVLKPPMVFSLDDANYFIQSLREILMVTLPDECIKSTSVLFLNNVHTPT